MFGTIDQAIDYCTKEDTRIAGPWLKGTPPQSRQGQRTDIDEAIEAITNGLHPDTRAFAERFPRQVIYHHQGLARYAELLASTPRTEAPLVYIFFGASRTGKSTSAAALHPYPYRKPPGKWWDGFCGQPVVIFEDFDPTAWQFTWNEFKRITDWTPMIVEKKGRTCELNFKTLCITTNTHPARFWETERSDPFERTVWQNRKLRIYQFFSDRVERLSVTET